MARNSFQTLFRSTSEPHRHCSQYHFQGGCFVILWNTTGFVRSPFSVSSTKTAFLNDTKWDFKLINNQSCFSTICKLYLVGINHRMNCFLPFMSWYNMLAGTAFQAKSQLVPCKGKGKAVLLQAWGGPEGSRKLRFPDCMTTAQDGGKVVRLTHRPPLPPGNIPCTRFF
jgi:hypothetical protein